MSNRVLVTCLAIFLAVFATALPAADDNPMDYEWTIGVDGKSVSAGTIVFKLTSAPNEDGTTDGPVEVEILVPNKAKTKDIQNTIENNLLAKLGDVRYQIRTSGNGKVSIKANKGTPWFLLEMTNNTVQGISIGLQR